MAFIQIYVASGEMEANLVKGFLESMEIKSRIAPSNSYLVQSATALATPNRPYGVYVEEEKAEEAKKILAER